MTRSEREVMEMKAFIVSAGCMAIEHISSAIRRSRGDSTIPQLRREMADLKHYCDMLQEDFSLNFPETRKGADGQ